MNLHQEIIQPPDMDSVNLFLIGEMLIFFSINWSKFSITLYQLNDIIFMAKNKKNWKYQIVSNLNFQNFAICSSWTFENFLENSTNFQNYLKLYECSKTFQNILELSRTL